MYRSLWTSQGSSLLFLDALHTNISKVAFVLSATHQCLSKCSFRCRKSQKSRPGPFGPGLHRNAVISKTFQFANLLQKSLKNIPRLYITADTPVSRKFAAWFLFPWYGLPADCYYDSYSLIGLFDSAFRDISPHVRTRAFETAGAKVRIETALSLKLP